MSSRRWHYELYLLPIMLLSLSVILVPALLTATLSFFDWDGIGDVFFVGFANFTDIFTDAVFFQALVHNLIWLLIFLTLPMLLALFAASLLSQLKRGAGFFQLVFLLPYTISPIVNTKIWSIILYNDFDGLLAFVNKALGWETGNPLGDPSLALPAVALIDMWHFWGFLTVILFAAIKQTPAEHLEVARLEGCNFWQKNWYVVLPHLFPTIRVLSIMVTIWSFLTFDYIYLTTQGGPARATEVLATLAYASAFDEYAVGRAAAISVVIGTIGSIAGVCYVYFSRKKA